MSEQKVLFQGNKEKEREIDLKELFFYVISYWYIIVAVVLAVGIAFGVYYAVFVPNEYTAHVSLYVRNRVNEQVISSSDLNGSAMLTYDYKELIKSRTVVGKTCELLGINNLNGYSVKVESVSNTRFITLSVTGPYPESVMRIANTMAEVFSETVLTVMEVDNVSIIDTAELPTVPSGPARMRNTALAAIIAGFGAVLVLASIDLLDTSIRTTEEIEEQLGIPVFAQIAIVKNEKKVAGK